MHGLQKRPRRLPQAAAGCGRRRHPVQQFWNASCSCCCPEWSFSDICGIQFASCCAASNVAARANWCASVEFHQAAGTVAINRHRGLGKLADVHLLHFKAFNALAAGIMSRKGCFDFELKVFQVVGVMQLSFARRAVSSVEILRFKVTDILGHWTGSVRSSGIVP